MAVAHALPGEKEQRHSHGSLADSSTFSGQSYELRREEASSSWAWLPSGLLRAVQRILTCWKSLVV